jgi:hypothetical protein
MVSTNLILFIFRTLDLILDIILTPCLFLLILILNQFLNQYFFILGGTVLAPQYLKTVQAVLI